MSAATTTQYPYSVGPHGDHRGKFAVISCDRAYTDTPIVVSRPFDTKAEAEAEMERRFEARAVRRIASKAMVI